MGVLNRFETKAQSMSYRLDPLLRLLPRLIIAAVFIPAGYGKLQNIGKTIEYFSSLNIPLATVQAPIAALCEITFGFFILLGFFTRLSTLPLLTIMFVALMTAHKNEISSLLSLTELAPALYAVILASIFTMGAGPLSLDQMLFRRK